MELWKTNNLFKAFLLLIIVAYLASIFLLHDPVLSQYLLVPLIAGTALYAGLGILPLLKKRRETAPSIQTQRAKTSRTTLISVFVIILLFVGAFLFVRLETAPTPGYQLVNTQFLITPNRTFLSLTPVTPSNECAWLESMNATTQQKARSQGLPDCDFAWPHANLAKPTLFLEYENYTEFTYTISNSSSAPNSTGTPVLCFTVPSQSYQCWLPPATVSNLR